MTAKKLLIPFKGTDRSCIKRAILNMWSSLAEPNWNTCRIDIFITSESTNMDGDPESIEGFIRQT
jgi:2C-methyl-D-erythritol 2,4-cyclodiphosphate synthase